MTRMRSLLPVLALAAVLPSAGCSIFCEDAPTHFVDLYIDAQARIVTLDADTAIPKLLLFRGDIVVFNNLTDKDVTIDLPKAIFGEVQVIIPASGRKMLKVLASSFEGKVIRVANGEYKIDGIPTVKVNEGP